MDTLLVLSVGFLVLGFVTKFMIGRSRVRELDRDFSFELICARKRAVEVAAGAARGVMWQLEFTENGLYTRHIFARNVIHVSVSSHPGQPGRCTAKVWTRVRLVDDGVFFLRARSYLDTKRKRDKIVRQLSVYRTVIDGRDATIG
jgi:hypothetical protein